MAIVKRYPTDDKQWNFHTYDPTGRDVIIPIRAVTVDDAWEQFDKVYGIDTPVDMVVEHTATYPAFK